MTRKNKKVIIAVLVVVVVFALGALEEWTKNRHVQAEGVAQGASVASEQRSPSANEGGYLQSAPKSARKSVGRDAEKVAKKFMEAYYELDFNETKKYMSEDMIRGFYTQGGSGVAYVGYHESARYAMAEIKEFKKYEFDDEQYKKNGYMRVNVTTVNQKGEEEILPIRMQMTKDGPKVDLAL